MEIQQKVILFPHLKTFKISSTSKMKSLEVSYKKVDIIKSLTKSDPLQKWKTIMTKRINGAEIEIYHVRTDENLLAASLTIDSTNYDIGEIGYGNMEDFDQTVRIVLL
ncbi:hypothetical protein D3C74_294180 [compost metagenome]